jgi:glycosyltransferase involved in cell wall biosynthesis
LLVSPDDPEGFTAVLAQLLNDLPRCRRYGAAGRNRVIQEFHFDRVVAQLEDLYQGLVPFPT